MGQPSAALQELIDVVKGFNRAAPVTWGALTDALMEAVESQRYAEYEDYMGDDL